jgi:hypothetical protein
VKSPSRARAWYPCRREHSLLCRRDVGSDSSPPWLKIVKTAARYPGSLPPTLGTKILSPPTLPTGDRRSKCIARHLFSKAPLPSVRIEHGRSTTPDSLLSPPPMPAVPTVFPAHIGRRSHRREKLPTAKSVQSHRVGLRWIPSANRGAHRFRPIPNRSRRVKAQFSTETSTAMRGVRGRLRRWSAVRAFFALRRPGVIGNQTGDHCFHFACVIRHVAGCFQDAGFVVGLQPSHEAGGQAARCVMDPLPIQITRASSPGGMATRRPPK